MWAEIKVEIWPAINKLRDARVKVLGGIILAMLGGVGGAFGAVYYAATIGTTVKGHLDNPQLHNALIVAGSTTADRLKEVEARQRVMQSEVDVNTEAVKGTAAKVEKIDDTVTEIRVQQETIKSNQRAILREIKKNGP